MSRVDLYPYITEYRYFQGFGEKIYRDYMAHLFLGEIMVLPKIVTKNPIEIKKALSKIFTFHAEAAFAGGPVEGRYGARVNCSTRAHAD